MESSREKLQYQYDLICRHCENNKKCSKNNMSCIKCRDTLRSYSIKFILVNE